MPLCHTGELLVLDVCKIVPLTEGVVIVVAMCTAIGVVIYHVACYLEYRLKIKDTARVVPVHMGW